MPGGNQLWLKDFEQKMDVKIDFTFEGTTNFVVEKHPNSELFALIDKEQVKKSIIEADLSKPYFTLLDVPVQVTADFDRDPIAAIKVFLEYDEEDEQGGGRKRQVEEFLFDSNEDRYYFRVVMARDGPTARPRTSTRTAARSSTRRAPNPRSSHQSPRTTGTYHRVRPAQLRERRGLLGRHSAGCRAAGAGLVPLSGRRPGFGHRRRGPAPGRTPRGAGSPTPGSRASPNTNTI